MSSDAAVWRRLESNPTVINNYMHQFGVDRQWRCVDVVSLDASMRDLIPQSCAALLLIFPLADVARSDLSIDPDDQRVVFVKQQTANACGTVALLHALANSAQIELAADSLFASLCAAARAASIEQRATLLSDNAQLAEAHALASKSADNQSREEGQRRDLHFVTFVASGGRLFELDGRQIGPIDHGACGDNEFLARASGVVTAMMRSAPSLLFSILALVHQPTEDDSHESKREASLGNIAQLFEMGLVRDEEHAREALERNHNDLNRTIATLLE